MAKKMSDEEMLGSDGTGSENALHGNFRNLGSRQAEITFVTATDNQLHDGDAERVTRSERKGRQIAETITHNRRKQSDKLKGGIEHGIIKRNSKKQKQSSSNRRGEIYYITNASKEHIGR